MICIEKKIQKFKKSKKKIQLLILYSDQEDLAAISLDGKSVVDVFLEGFADF
jgi:hypothetical protein